MEIIGTNRSETLRGGKADDIFGGLGGNDILYGEGGDDVFVEEGEFGWGNDTIYGGAGIDLVSYYGNTAPMVVNMRTGRVEMGTFEDSLHSVEAVVTGNKSDVLMGRLDGMFAALGGGADKVIGIGHDAFYDGGIGDDLLKVRNADGAVAVDLTGGWIAISDGPFAGLVNIESFFGARDHENVFVGNAQRNHFVGGKAQDDFSGGALSDILDGRLGDDVLRGDTGADTLLGGGGNDKLFGGADADILHGGNGADLLRDIDHSEYRDNELYGGGGRDKIVIGTGIADGGGSNDRIIRAEATNDTHLTSWVTIDAGLGDDTILIEWGRVEAHGGAGDDVFEISDGANFDVAIRGGAGTDTVLVHGHNHVVVNEDTSDFESFTGIERLEYTSTDPDDEKTLRLDADGIEVQFSAGIYTAYVDGDGNTIRAADATGDMLVELNGTGNNLVAGLGADRIIVSASDNTVHGGGGDDEIDVAFHTRDGGIYDVYGDDGADDFFLTQADGTADGGAGDDQFYFNYRDGTSSTVTGGAGEDVFYIVSGSCVIEDFEVGSDRIIYDVGGPEQAYANSTATQVGDDVLIIGLFGPDKGDWSTEVLLLNFDIANYSDTVFG